MAGMKMSAATCLSASRGLRGRRGRPLEGVRHAGARRGVQGVCVKAPAVLSTLHFASQLFCVPEGANGRAGRAA